MKALFNGMLPPAMVERLADLWPDSAHVVTSYGERVPDTTVWERARENGYTIITRDHDFADAMRFPGPPPQAIRLRLGNATSNEVEAYVRAHFEEIARFMESNERYDEI